jgi:phospholipid-translocating ATPase
MSGSLGCMSIKALGHGQKKIETEVRIIQCNDIEANAALKFASNYISTTKYTVITFIPKALYEQFRRVANLYFTFVAALSLTPLTPISPITTITPLCAVIGVSIAKEAWEDYKRAKEDKAVNNRLVDVYAGEGKLESRPWKAVRVG